MFYVSINTGLLVKEMLFVKSVLDVKLDHKIFKKMIKELNKQTNKHNINGIKDILMA